MRIAAALLVTAVLAGGGGSPSPLAELAVELAAVAALVAWRWLPNRYPGQSPDRLILLPGALLLALVAIQLVPLPPGLWRALPGRGTEAASLQLIGEQLSWRPITLSVPRTLASLLSLIPPLTILYFASRLTLAERARLLTVVAGLALLAALVGAVQVASGNAHWLYFYQYTAYDWLVGFQANRNATPDMLVIGGIAASATVAGVRDRLRGPAGLLGLAGAWLVIAMAVVLTGSRGGVLILPIGLLATLALLPPRVIRPRRLAAAGAIVALLAVATALLALHSAALDRTWQRFAFDSGRQPIWADTRFAIRQYWPVGSGVGTFVPVFVAAERLEYVERTVPNRAHDDYLEFTLEAGLAAFAVLLAGVLIAGWRGWQRLRDDAAPGRALAIFAFAAIAVLAAHAVMDYPMRSISLASLGALAFGLLGRPPSRGGMFAPAMRASNPA